MCEESDSILCDATVLLNIKAYVIRNRMMKIIVTGSREK
jgi:hypothetical protein